MKDFFSKAPKAKELEEAYRKNVWAYRGINAIATAAGQVPFKMVEKTAAGGFEDVEGGHEFIDRLLDNPNPFMTGQDLLEYLFIFAESTGAGYWLFDDGGAGGRSGKLKLSQVKELWPIPSHQIEPMPDAKEFIKGFRFEPDGSGKGENFSVDEVFRIVYPSPVSMLYGQGSIEAVTGDLASDIYAAAFEKFIMRNLASNTIFLRTDGTFTPDQEEEYRRSLAKVFKNVRIGFMQSGLDFAVPQIAAKDLPFLELDQRRQKRILGAMGVPPIMAGSEDAKYDNAEQQKRFFWGDTMKPKLNRVGKGLTKKLWAMGESDKLHVVPNYSGIAELQPDAKVRAETGKVWVDMGYPLNLAIKTFGVPGMEEIDGGDVGLVSAALIPLEDAVNPPDPEMMEPEGTDPMAPPPGKPGKKPKPGAEPDDEEDEEKGFKSAIADKAIDDARWKRFIKGQEGGFRRLRVEVRRHFEAQRKTILARLREHAKSAPDAAVKSDPRVALILLDINEETKKLAKKTGPIIRSIYKKYGEQAVADVGASIVFNLASPKAASFLANHTFKFSFEVENTTRQRLAALLQEKFMTGVPQQELTDAVVKEFGFYERYRAARIARTESGIAGNSGIFEGMKQAGVTKKRWISARDEKVRHSHEVADGQEVGIDDVFDVGGALLAHPGDPNGPAAEIINCRCAVRAARQKE